MTGAATWSEKAIVKRLDAVVASGHRPIDVFRDWLAMVEVTLRMRPAHVVSLREHKRFAEEPPDVATLFVRMRSVYTSEDFEQFGIALGELQHQARLCAQRGEYADIVGYIYESWGSANTNMGQFFTPLDVARVMALMTVDVEELHRRLKSAINTSTMASAALLTMHIFENTDEAFAWYVARVIPAALEHFEPITVCDPACGSGVTLLAVAERFPGWAVQLGLVQFYGQDLDHICVQMTATNLMLYGMNGQGAPALLAWAERVLAQHSEIVLEDAA